MSTKQLLSTTRAASSAPSVHRATGRGLLVTGGVLSALNGAAHWILPVVYPWEQHVAGLYEPVRWALYATTVFFGVLLVLGGILTILVATASDLPRRVVGWVAGGMAAFWVIGTVYEVAAPFPDPVAGVALPLFSAAVALLYLIGLRAHMRAAVAERAHPSRASS